MTPRVASPVSVRRATTRSVALALVALTQACGAKTGLRVPDVTVDAPDAFDVPDVPDVPDVADAPDTFDAPDVFDVVDVPDVPDVADVPEDFQLFETCVAGTFGLRPREAEVMFVIDRSGSMVNGLDGMPPPTPDDTRWLVLARALEAALPPFQNSISMGAVFFPAPTHFMQPAAQQCRVSAEMTLPTAHMNAAAITNVLRTTDPGGGTPTFAALDVARAYFDANPDRSRARYFVLATDGEPNCNPALDRFTCMCTSRDDTGTPLCASGGTSGAYNCLDDGRTITSLEASTAAGIPTYVIGIDDSSRPDLAAVLNRMAVAGGRPSTDGSATRYYSVRRPADLANAFAAIQRGIAQCAFVTPSRPDDPDAIAVLIDGAITPRDPARRQGWDWTDRAYGEITFFGAACDRAVAARTNVTARVGCNSM